MDSWIALRTDTCSGAIVQYYNDKVCTIYAGSSDLESYSTQCVVAHNSTALIYGSTVYETLHCSTSTVPVINEPSGIVM